MRWLVHVRHSDGECMPTRGFILIFKVRDLFMGLFFISRFKAFACSLALLYANQMTS